MPLFNFRTPWKQNPSSALILFELCLYDIQGLQMSNGTINLSGVLIKTVMADKLP